MRKTPSDQDLASLHRPARQVAFYIRNGVLLTDHCVDRMQTKEKQKFGMEEKSLTAQHSGCNQRQHDKPGRLWGRDCISAHKGLSVMFTECFD